MADKYFLKVYRTDPKNIDEHGHIMEAAPLLPLFGHNIKAVDYLGKTTDYSERDDTSDPSAHDRVYNQKISMYDDNLEPQHIITRKPTRRGASVFSYAFPENAVNHSSGLTSDPQDIKLSKPGSRLGFLHTDEGAKDDLLSRILTYSSASAARNGPRFFRKFWENNNKLAPVVTIVQAPDTSVITDDEIINDDYDAWKDFNEEFQLKSYTPIAQLPFEDFITSKELDKNKVAELLHKAFPEALRGNLKNSNYKAFEAPVARIFKDKLGFDKELAAMLGRDIACNVIGYANNNEPFESSIEQSLQYLPERFNIFDKNKFIDNFKYDKNITPSDECMKNIKKDLASDIRSYQRLNNILRGISNDR